MNGHSVELIDPNGVVLWKGVLRWIPRKGDFIQSINGNIVEVIHVTYIIDTACVLLEVVSS